MAVAAIASTKADLMSEGILIEVVSYVLIFRCLGVLDYDLYLGRVVQDFWER